MTDSKGTLNSANQNGEIESTVLARWCAPVSMGLIAVLGEVSVGGSVLIYVMHREVIKHGPVVGPQVANLYRLTFDAVMITTLTGLLFLRIHNAIAAWQYRRRQRMVGK